MRSRTSFISVFLALICLGNHAEGQTFTRPLPQILHPVDDSLTITLTGNVHPLVRAAHSSTPADLGTPMEHMILYLKGNPVQEAQLEQLVAQQNDPKSPLYHQYLTPQNFGAQFGAADSDLSKVTAWLGNQGFKVEQVPAGNRAVIFSGNSMQVARAFKTEIRKYTVGGETHYANASDPQIPEALAGAVGGVVKLHDFQHTAHISKTNAVTATELAEPQFNYGASHYLAPADYSTIYHITSLYTAGINGAGQAIAVLARSNIYLSDIQSFRSQFGLKANNPQIVITSTDPGVLQGDSVETTLDTEWSGAIAPNASVKVIIAASTNTADGIDLAALYAVNNNVAPIISLSYGSCEAAMGSVELAFYNSLWKQAATQGISVMVSSGDSGAAGCDYGSVAQYGRAINGLCSSPYSTCVGGTEFVEGTNPGQWWLPGNNPTYGSAISYIPETVWNESGSNGGSGLWSAGGGASIIYSKPTWQTGPGVPADSRRDVPDVSLAAAGHDGYLIWLSGSLHSVGGTSAAAPSFAGMMALVGQKIGARAGLANAILYPLAMNQAAGGAAVFHDITTGTNTVPGAAGFAAAAGYDLASGLGSVDASQLVNHWGDTSNTGSLSLSAAVGSLTVIVGQSAQTTVTSTVTGSLKSAVTLSIAGAPAGLTATFAATTIAAPGSGSDVLRVAASAAVTPGTYSLTVTGAGGGQTAKLTIAVVVPTPTFTLSASSTAVNITSGSAGQLALSIAAQNGFSASMALSIAGLPAGVAAAFLPSTIGAAGGSSALTLTVASTAKAKSYPLIISATGGGITRTLPVTLLVAGLPACVIGSNPRAATLNAGTKTSLQVSCSSPTGTFNGPLALSITGAPAGMTAQFFANTLVPGGTRNLNIGTANTTAPGTYNLAYKVSGSGYTQTLLIPVTVVPPTAATHR